MVTLNPCCRTWLLEEWFDIVTRAKAEINIGIWVFIKLLIRV
jgi:hypothetical protein